MSNFSQHKMEYLCCCSCSWSFHMGDEDDLHVTAKSWLLLLTLQTSLSLLLVILITIIGQETCMASHWKSVGIKKRIGNKKNQSTTKPQSAKKQTTTSSMIVWLVTPNCLAVAKKKGLSSHLVFLQTMSCFLNSRSQWHQGIHGIQGSMRICEFFQCQGKQEFLV